MIRCQTCFRPMDLDVYIGKKSLFYNYCPPFSNKLKQLCTLVPLVHLFQTSFFLTKEISTIDLVQEKPVQVLYIYRC